MSEHLYTWILVYLSAWMFKSLIIESLHFQMFDFLNVWIVWCLNNWIFTKLNILGRMSKCWMFVLLFSNFSYFHVEIFYYFIFQMLEKSFIVEVFENVNIWDLQCMSIWIFE